MQPSTDTNKFAYFGLGFFSAFGSGASQMKTHTAWDITILLALSMVGGLTALPGYNTTSMSSQAKIAAARLEGAQSAAVKVEQVVPLSVPVPAQVLPLTNVRVTQEPATLANATGIQQPPQSPMSPTT